MLIGTLSSGDRQKIMTICTIEVHNRDVVSKLISQRVENAQAFTWLSQVRHRWDDGEQDCFANICDAQFRYSHEYLGNSTRLVITPLTDRFATLRYVMPILRGWVIINAIINRLWGFYMKVCRKAHYTKKNSCYLNIGVIFLSFFVFFVVKD